MPIDSPFTIVLFLLLVVAFVVAAWFVFVGKSVFVIRFTSAGTAVTKGSPPSQFVSALEALRQDCRINKGRVVGKATEGKRIRVVASSNLAPAIRQRVRNLWSVYG